MHNYELFMFGYDGNVKIILQHNKLYTDNQFKNLVTDVFVNICKKQLKEYPEGEHIKEIWGEDIFSEVCDSLIKIYGFKEPKYAATFSMIDYADFLNNEENTQDEMVNLIKSKLCEQ